MASRSALLTVLFTDIVGSTEIADELGNARWRELLSRHHRVIRRELRRFGGTEIDTAGDGFFAVFDRPTQAVRCAAAAIEAVHELGIELRAGLHVGEVERTREGASGVAVHLGARIGAAAGRGEVLVSDTVRQLTRGSGIVLEDRGVHALKGVPEPQALFSVSEADGKPLSPALREDEARARRDAIDVAVPPERRRRVALRAGAAVIAAVVVAVVLIAVTREDAPPSAQGGELHGAVVRIDADRAQIARTIPGLATPGRKFSRSSPHVHVGEGGVWVLAGRRLQHIDLATGDVNTVPISVGLSFVQMTIGLHQVWIFEDDRKQVTGISSGSLEITDEIGVPAETGDFISSMAVSGRWVWVGGRSDLYRIDPVSGSVRTFPVAQDIDELVASGDSLILVDELAETLTRVDPETATVMETVELQTVSPDVVEPSGDGGVWILDTIARSLHEVTPDGEVSESIEVGEDPTALAVGDEAIWVTDEERHVVHRVDPELRKVVATIHLGGRPTALDVDAETGDVWVYIG